MMNQDGWLLEYCGGDGQWIKSHMNLDLDHGTTLVITIKNWEFHRKVSRSLPKRLRYRLNHCTEHIIVEFP